LVVEHEDVQVMPAREALDQPEEGRSDFVA
jgi:hypothetical protein